MKTFFSDGMYYKINVGANIDISHQIFHIVLVLISKNRLHPLLLANCCVVILNVGKKACSSFGSLPFGLMGRRLMSFDTRDVIDQFIYTKEFIASNKLLHVNVVE